jgi:hypothetical protein
VQLLASVIAPCGDGHHTLPRFNGHLLHRCYQASHVSLRGQHRGVFGSCHQADPQGSEGLRLQHNNVPGDGAQACASTSGQVSYSSHARCNAWLWSLPQSRGIPPIQTMTQRIATYVIVIAAFMGIGTQISIHQLDKATAHQCINHEWPVEAHDIHLAWCAANNYPTN